mgnify:CR=1 FL=1
MSMKKSIGLVVAVIIMVTAFQLMTSGSNAMLIDMSDTAISFSGIDDFRHEVAYEEIESVVLDDITDWSVFGGHEFGHFRVGHMEDYVLFVTIQCDNAVILRLKNQTLMIFNYNNRSDTEAIYNMLLENIQ